MKTFTKAVVLAWWLLVSDGVGNFYWIGPYDSYTQCKADEKALIKAKGDELEDHGLRSLDCHANLFPAE